LSGVIFPFTFTTLKGDELHRRLFTCHNSSPSGSNSPHPWRPLSVISPQAESPFVRKLPVYSLQAGALTGGAHPVRLTSPRSAFAPFDSAFGH
jgi:hypothetical protein